VIGVGKFVVGGCLVHKHLIAEADRITKPVFTSAPPLGVKGTTNLIKADEVQLTAVAYAPQTPPRIVAFLPQK
jgi:hypothetical protein